MNNENQESTNNGADEVTIEYFFINVIKNRKKYKVEYMINYSKYFEEVKECLDNIAEIVDVNDTNIKFFGNTMIEVNINSNFKEYLIINIIKTGVGIKFDFMINYTNYRDNQIIQTNLNKIIEKDMEDDQDDETDENTISTTQIAFQEYIQRSISVSPQMFNIENPMIDQDASFSCGTPFRLLEPKVPVKPPLIGALEGALKNWGRTEVVAPVSFGKSRKGDSGEKELSPKGVPLKNAFSPMNERPILQKWKNKRNEKMRIFQET